MRELALVAVAAAGGRAVEGAGSIGLGGVGVELVFFYAHHLLTMLFILPRVL